MCKINKMKIIKVSSNDCQTGEDTSIIISSSDEFKSENYLLKIKAPEYISKFFQEINDHEYDLNIKDIIDWYSNLDEQTKIGITSINNSEFIRLLCNEIILKKNPAPNDELKSETKIIKTITFNDPSKQEQFESKSVPSLVENTNFQNLVNNKESTTDTENKKEQYINPNIIKEEDLLENTNICSLREDADILIFNIDPNKLEECLNFFPKKDSTIKPIIPEKINNVWHITLPDLDNLPETLSFCQIMASILILLNFEYKCNNTNKTYEMPFFKELRKFSQSNELKINELLEKNVDVTNDIFNEYNTTFIAKKCSNYYIKKYSKDKKFNSEELDNFNKKILKILKNNFLKSKSNKKKLKKLFEKISFYNLRDLKNSRQFIYLNFRNYLLKYNELSQKIDSTYRTIIYNNQILEPFRKKYLKETKRMLEKILGSKIKIVEYGSFFTGLCTEYSDMDILIFVEEIKDEKKFLEDLETALEKIRKKKNIKNLKIKPILHTKNSPPIIKIEYDISKEIDLTEINSSLKNLDAKKDDDFNKIRIDIAFTNDIKKVENTKKTVEIIIDSLKKYKQLKTVILYLKTFFRIQELYSTYKGGINSLSLFCLARNILVTYERNHFDVNLFSKEKLLFYISEKFGHYKYNYGINKDGFDYTLKDKEIVEKEEDLRLIIKSPVDNEKNIAYGSFKSREIIEKFHLLFDYINKNNLV